MSRSSFPSLRHHKPTEQGVVTVRLASGARKDLYCGRYGTAAATAEYNRIVGLLAVNGGVYPHEDTDLTVAEALVRYAHHIDKHYVDLTGAPTGTANDIRVTLGYIKRLFAPLPLIEFGIPQLKLIREAMVADGRVRNQVNRRIGMVRGFAKWCVEEGLVSPVVLEGLRAVRPLALGRSGVKEGERVEPANPVSVEKAIPFLSKPLAAVVRLLRLTGARPSEILLMRPCDLDRSGSVWVLTPARHKGSWRGKPRFVHFGPEAQAVLAPWIEKTGASDEHVFSPARAEAERNAERSVARKTKRWPSHMKRNATKRKGAARTRPIKYRYSHLALSCAVRRACEKAGVEAFTPYQLRHLKAVELRERYGLEHVRATLGHSFAAMSDHYSKAADATLAARAAAETG
ncbi:catalytic phage domain protein : Site-specific recombinase XerD OS=Singulisphaera acidiphila (strain ATCC BAA-1392 / DSM 18658 / VKM B-2454 / MOB10) GN=Sinac_1635 PE=4 SV=1: Phage_integrase [Gemmata massiliana]|uniref:Tyr recombinase domain-containing protein n=1 Tax=Gemmata massiliana TaxID=1210884 RepID=A0A6P2CVH7_9BACT|nr:site-specific integrase [Gemmata massiliana]VTR92155.1 catalytic phage domain protein : Site-specific recombinase XerD OS=Singulisphaera acidiphila (strain ATCC BAA-1392 / DSM 18658 / VKM B-2454 / MOB10) GN=Sinac_1635 PE=4 SV=1: Phage_integrase [Gemmata massiliana]